MFTKIVRLVLEEAKSLFPGSCSWLLSLGQLLLLHHSLNKYVSIIYISHANYQECLCSTIFRPAVRQVFCHLETNNPILYSGWSDEYGYMSLCVLVTLIGLYIE